MNNKKSFNENCLQNMGMRNIIYAKEQI
jgi:hypothetical protein